MIRAALYVSGKIVTGQSHIEAFFSLSEQEKDQPMANGFIDTESGEFFTYDNSSHFYHKHIILVRHALVQLDDDDDPDLSEDGVTQVIQLTKTLPALNEFTCFSSPMLRCLRTSMILSNFLDLSVIVDPDLIECQSCDLKYRKKDFPKFQWPESEGCVIKNESKASFQSKALSVLKRLPPKSFIVSHQGFIVTLSRLALCDEKVFSAGVTNASVTIIKNQEVVCLGRNPDEYDLQF